MPEQVTCSLPQLAEQLTINSAHTEEVAVMQTENSSPYVPSLSQDCSDQPQTVISTLLNRITQLEQSLADATNQRQLDQAQLLSKLLEMEQRFSPSDLSSIAQVSNQTFKSGEPNPSINTNIKNASTSRRKLLKRMGYMAAGLAAAGAVAVTSSTTDTAQAASGDNVLLGNSNLASDTTYLSQTGSATTLNQRAILWADYNATGQSTNPGSLTTEYKIGLAGSSTSSISTDVAIGGYFTGSTAPLLLEASATAGFPTTGTHKKGEFYVDNAGDLWYLASTTSGNQWRKLAGAYTLGTLHAIAPFRLLDTGDAGASPVVPPVLVATVKSSSLGGLPTGKFAALESRVYQINGGTSPIPVTAKGIVGNFGASHVVFPGLPGQTSSAGFGSIFPSGLTAPTASSLSFHNTGYSATGFSNNYTVALDTATTGEVRISLYSFRAARIILDVTGYYL